MKFAVQHLTLGDGWINTWTDTDNDEPVVYETREEAQAALDEHLGELQDAADKGDMAPYSADEFRIAEVEDEPARFRCDSCEALMINELFCHELGCPNSRKRYDADSDRWIEQITCFDCGYTRDIDDQCCADND